MADKREVIKNVDYYKKDIVKKMRKIKSYNKSFDHVIDVYARLLVEYDRTLEQFAKSGESYIIKHTNKNGSTNIVKNPIYLIIEKQRTDILGYARELGLTPSGLKKLNDELSEKKESKLEKALNGL